MAAKDAKALLADPAKVDEAAAEAFAKIDTDNSGFVVLKELNAAMKEIATASGVEMPSPEEAQKVFKAMDKNEDNKVSLDEFKEIIKAVAKAVAEGA